MESQAQLTWLVLPGTAGLSDLFCLVESVSPSVIDLVMMSRR